MNIAILGFGTIGSGVYEIIESKKSSYLYNTHVVKVLDLPQNKDKLSIITSDINDIVNDKTIDLVVETMGGIHPAFEFITACLKSGKHVVTANKAVVAAHLSDFLECAKANNVKFLFEASVGGGIPWLASITKAKRIDAIDHVYGIFNGTTNFILHSMYKDDKDFSEVLKLAQELGYAEANPSADIDGYDVQNKIVISSALAYNATIDMKEFPCFSMAKVSIDDVHYLKEKDMVIKYIGESKRIDNEYEAFVMPNVFAKDKVEANVNTNFNICTLHGETIGDLKFYGQGAGKLPTANAIVQDILDIESLDYAIRFDNKLVYNNEMLGNKFLLRSTKELKHENIEKIELYNNKFYMYTKTLSTKDFMELAKQVLYYDEEALIAKIADF